jgi:hypothetical protein
MTLYSYIVKHDTGFAPNPFFGYCTLACCKPGIRRHAKKDDWIVGLTPSAKGRGNKIVYFMEVEESFSFGDYWRDPRFKQKRPKLDADIARKSGDNIYKPLPNGDYHQMPSAHSNPQFGKGEDPETKERDVFKGERVLVSRNFVYFGSKAKELPSELQALRVGRSYLLTWTRTCPQVRCQGCVAGVRCLGRRVRRKSTLKTRGSVPVTFLSSSGVSGELTKLRLSGGTFVPTARSTSFLVGSRWQKGCRSVNGRKERSGHSTIRTSTGNGMRQTSSTLLPNGSSYPV